MRSHVQKVATRGNILAGLLVGLIMLSGCAFPGQDEEPTVKVDFATNWSGSAYHYFLTANEALPASFKVVVLEKETGVRQEFTASQLSQRLPNKYDVRSGVALREGNTYRIEGFAGEKSVGFRELKAYDAGLDQPDLTLRASYSFQMTMKDTTPDNSSDMAVRGNLQLDATPTKLVTKFTGSGTLNTSSEGMTQRLTLTTFDTEDEDNDTKKFIMAGQGPWTLSGDPSGSGQATIRSDFQGKENKADKSGKLHACEKTQIRTETRGTLTSQGETFQIVSISTEWEWARVDNEEVIWRKSESTTTITYPDGTPETTNDNSDAAVEGEEAEPDLFDVTDFTGFSPSPFAKGDSLQMKGLEGVTIQYSVSDGGSRQAAGQSFSALKVEGIVSGGATGSETWYVVEGGSLADMPLTWTSNYQRGQESASFKAELISLT